MSKKLNMTSCLGGGDSVVSHEENKSSTVNHMKHNQTQFQVEGGAFLEDHHLVHDTPMVKSEPCDAVAALLLSPIKSDLDTGSFFT
jgi:hypothetical protein